MLDNIKALSSLPGVSGREDAVRQYILGRIGSLADDIRVDNAGNIIALRKGSGDHPRRIMVSAHMDEVGLMITAAQDNGLLRFTPVGKVDPRVICGRRVYIGDSSIPGVVGMLPIHLTEDDDRSKCPDCDKLTIDIGADSKEGALAAVNIGDYGVFASQYTEFGSGMISGKALDDRAGCAVLIDLMQGSYRDDVYFAFLATDEVGEIGAACAAYSIAPDIAISVDAVRAGDIPGASGCACSLGKGAVVSFVDNRAIYDRELCARALRLGEEKDIAVQIKQTTDGISDAIAILSSRGGVRTVAIGLPCRYPRTGASVMAKSDITAVRELAAAMLDEEF